MIIIDFHEKNRYSRNPSSQVLRDFVGRNRGKKEKGDFHSYLWFGWIISDICVGVLDGYKVRRWKKRFLWGGIWVWVVVLDVEKGYTYFFNIYMSLLTSSPDPPDPPDQVCANMPKITGSMELHVPYPIPLPPLPNLPLSPTKSFFLSASVMIRRRVYDSKNISIPLSEIRFWG